MDSERFDAFTRSLCSRRTALGGLVGALGALIGLPAPEEAAAHNFMARCRRIKDPVSRRRCLQQAKAHNRRHRLSTPPPPPPCVPQSPALTCAGRCGVYANDCNQATACPCPAGKTCISNGSCSRACAATPPLCPAGCFCTSGPVEGGPNHCAGGSGTSCSEFPVICTSTTGCPLGYYCANIAVGCGTNRCFPVCPS